jgi:itaconate CoA-transferase
MATPPGGYDHVVHGKSAYFVWLNRGQESLVLDFKNAADATLLGVVTFSLPKTETG